MDDILKLLLDADAPDVRRTLPQKQVQVKRLSEMLGKPAIFVLQALPYGRVQEIRRMPEDDQEIHILLSGCVSPDLKSQTLRDKYDAVTPVDAVKALLLPGEIADLSREVERLSGYRRVTIDEVKNV